MLDNATHDLIKKRNKKNALAAAAAAVLLGAARVAVTRWHVDPILHFYTAPWARFFDYAIAACIIFIWASSRFAYKYKGGGGQVCRTAASVFTQGTQTLVFTASVCGFLLAASAALQGWQLWRLFGDAYGLAFAEFLLDYLRGDPFDIFIFAAALFGSAYFFRTAALDQEPGEKKYSQGYIMLSFAPVLWAFLNTFRCFFDLSRAVNSPVKIYELLSFLALSIYFVSESRMLVGRLGLAKFLTFAYIAAILTAMSALPNLILSSFWIMQINDAPIIYAVQITLALYIGARMYSQIRYGGFAPDAENQETKNIK